MLARRFADLESGVSSVIIANGESQVDAVAAAGLAGSRNAAVLLTRPARLPHNVARFIDNQNVTSVTIVGGTAAVSEAVETTLKGLGSKPTVTRLAGANRFATAAMIGGALGGPNPTWCGSSQRAAILVNGRDAGMSDAVVAGPLAYRLGLPMLLTEADELPAETRKFLTDNRVERVVVIGGTTAVSAGVINTLTEDVGVVSAPRIAGASAAATSVEVAKEMRGACKDVLNVDFDRVALLNSTATADGIAAAPVLGRGLSSGGGSVPILLVDSALPAEVRDFLASTPEVRGGNKTHMNVVAVGGKAVVTDAVMSAAVEAAITSSDLTATISFDATAPNKFTVTYSDDVVEKDDATTTAFEPNVTDPNLYRINGRRLSAQSTSGNTTSEGARAAEEILRQGRVVTVTVSSALKTSDVVSVEGGAQVGANGDKRKLKGASLTISRPAAPVDTSPPRVEIVAVAGSTNFDIIVTEPNFLGIADPTNPSGSPYQASDGITWEKCATCTARAQLAGGTNPTFDYLDYQLGPDRPALGLGSSSKVLGVGIFRIQYNLHQSPTPSTLPTKLQAGDVITVKRNTFLDKNGRGNALIRYVVPAATATLRLSNVWLGNKQATANPTARIETGATPADNDLKVTAKATGIAAGSAGNGWKIFGWRLPTVDTKKAVDIDVAVDTPNKIITWTWRNGDATVRDLAQELNKNTTFAANFSVDFWSSTTADQQAGNKLGTTISATSVTLGDTSVTGVTEGKSAVAVRFVFNQYIRGRNVVNMVRDLLGVSGAISNPAFHAATRTQSVTGAGISGYTIKVLNEPTGAVLSIESAEKTATTKLPARSGTRIFRFGLGAGYHATSPGSQPTVLTSLRTDASLKICMLDDVTDPTRAKTVGPCSP